MRGKIITPRPQSGIIFCVIHVQKILKKIKVKVPVNKPISSYSIEIAILFSSVFLLQRRDVLDTNKSLPLRIKFFISILNAVI